MIYNKTKLSARLQLAGVMIWEVSAATPVEEESAESRLKPQPISFPTALQTPLPC